MLTQVSYDVLTIRTNISCGPKGNNLVVSCFHWEFLHFHHPQHKNAPVQRIFRHCCHDMLVFRSSTKQHHIECEPCWRLLRPVDFAPQMRRRHITERAQARIQQEPQFSRAKNWDAQLISVLPENLEFRPCARHRID